MQDQEQQDEQTPLTSPDRTNPRSSSYQFIFGEVSVSPFALAAFLDLELSPDSNDQLNELKGQLMDRLMTIIKNDLTERQSQILLLWLAGNIQWDIAKITGGNQSCINKCIYGNATYKDGKKTSYGGCIRKLKKLTAKDPIIQDLLKQIQELDL